MLREGGYFKLVAVDFAYKIGGTNVKITFGADGKVAKVCSCIF
jgi:hypothetical protein